MISRKPIQLFLFTGLVLLGSGCANLVETQTIEQFSQALQEKDLNQLKTTSSDEFEQKALRHARALDDFRILNLPEGETSVVNIEEISDTEKKVTVEVGEYKRKLLYNLVLDPQTENWVVDDIYVRQKREGLQTAKSVTEQMDLLLTVREFLQAWDGGSRQKVLAATTPKFQKILEKLPPTYLADLTQQVVGKRSRTSALHPEAEMDEDIAVVRLPRTTGEIVLSLKLQNGNWKTDDIAVNTRDAEKRVPSVQKLAIAVHTASSFLESYANQDKQKLRELCTESFFKGSLAPADLSLVSLPGTELVTDKYRIELHESRADFFLNGENDILRLSLLLQQGEDADAPTRYLVEEATLYDVNGSQDRRLSSLFTSHAVMQIFSDALIGRDLAMLKQTSTPDFKKRVWSRLDEQQFRTLPLKGIQDASPDVVDTEFNGSVTEITVQQGAQKLTYILRDRNGELEVDDVHVPIPGHPESLKQTLEVLLPIYNFSTGMRLANLNVLQRSSSRDFNRLVWHQARQIPQTRLSLSDHLQGQISSVQFVEEEALVVIGDNQFGARILLVKEHGRYAVDDILLIAGPGPQQRERLKQSMREQLANGYPRSQPTQTISPAANPQVSNPAPQQFNNATPQVANPARAFPQNSDPLKLRSNENLQSIPNGNQTQPISNRPTQQFGPERPLSKPSQNFSPERQSFDSGQQQSSEQGQQPFPPIPQQTEQPRQSAPDQQSFESSQHSFNPNRQFSGPVQQLPQQNQQYGQPQQPDSSQQPFGPTP